MYIYTFILCRKIRKENRGTNTRCLKISKLGKDICQALGPLARNDRRVESWWLQPIPKFWGVILHHPQAVFSYDIVCTCHTACIHNTHIYIYICIYIYTRIHTQLYIDIYRQKKLTVLQTILLCTGDYQSTELHMGSHILDVRTPAVLHGAKVEKCVLEADPGRSKLGALTCCHHIHLNNPLNVWNPLH